MAADETVDEIKRRLDIVDYVADYVQLKRSGRNFKGLCPFHEEKTPSFMVSAEKQIFHCFGCGAGGDVLAFAMKRESLSFPEAVENLAKRAGVEIKRTPEQGRARTERQSLKTVQSEALTYFKGELKKNKRAMDYLTKRGITQASIDSFSLGYAPDGWHNLHNHLKGRGFMKADDTLAKSGLFGSGQKGLYDMFRDRIIFPIFDVQGECIAFGGRIMESGEPKYLNSPDTPLFHKSENLYALEKAREPIRKEGFALIAEGYMDVIVCHQHGIENAVAPLGTALTPDHAKRLARYTDKIVVVFDGDAAGIAAARRSLILILEAGLRVKVMVLPEKHDPDSLLREQGPDAFRKLLKEAVTPMQFMLAGQRDSKTVNEILGVVVRIEDPVLRDEMVVELADRTRIDERAIREKLQRMLRPSSRHSRRPALQTMNEEALLVSTALNAPATIAIISKGIDPATLDDQTLGSVLAKLIAAGPSRTGDPLTLVEGDAEREIVTRLTMKPGFDTEHAEASALDCIRKIARMKLDRRIKEAEAGGDAVILQELLAERQRLMQRGI